jgi:hypothetical protein
MRWEGLLAQLFCSPSYDPAVLLKLAQLLSEGVKEGIAIQRVNHPRVRGSGGHSTDERSYDLRTISIKVLKERKGEQ